MTAALTPVPKIQFFAADGTPLVGGKLYTYAAGTTTPLATYTTPAGTVANSNPVILDSRGEADVCITDALYKFALYTATDTLIWTVDNINSTFNGPVQGTTATFSGALTALSGAFSGPVSGTTGTFSGNVQMASANGGQLAGLRNKIINGNMRVAQRGTVPFTVSVPATGTFTYTADRFILAQVTAATSAAVTGGVISDNALGGSSGGHIYMSTTVAKATLAAGDYGFMGQVIEGFNVADLKYGTASAKTVTISFRALAVGIGSTAVIGVSIRNSGASRSYVVPVTITNVAADYSVTIPGDTTGTWLTNNGTGMQVSFCSAAGTNYQTTANSWQAGNFLSTSAQTNFLGTAICTLAITDVQLELGPVATPFEQRPYGMELALCQRYFQTVDTGLAGYTQPSISNAYTCQYPVPMRATPLITVTGSTNTNTTGSTVISASATQYTHQSLGAATGGFISEASARADAEL